MKQLALVVSGCAAIGVVVGVLASSVMEQDGWGLVARLVVGALTALIVSSSTLIAALSRDG